MFYCKKFKFSQNDSKKPWSNVKQLLNSNKYNKGFEVNDNDRCYKGDQLPTIFNEYFNNGLLVA